MNKTMILHQALILLMGVAYLSTAFSKGTEELSGTAYSVNEVSSENASLSGIDAPETWVAVARSAVAVGRVTVAATRQAVAVTRVYTPEAGNLARTARISVAIAYNLNKHIRSNFPEKELQKKFRLWDLDNA